MTGALQPLQNQTYTGAQLVQVIGFMAKAGITFVGEGNQIKVESTKNFSWLDEDRSFASDQDILAYLAPLVVQHGPTELGALLGKVAA